MVFDKFLPVFVFLLAMDVTQPALAYLDPTTGSMALQALVGGIAGALFVIKIYWLRIKNFFSRKKNIKTVETKE